MPKPSAALRAANSALLYVGHGEWIRGVPARDLSADEVERLGLDSSALTRSGLYRKAARPSAADEPSADLERSDR